MDWATAMVCCFAASTPGTWARTTGTRTLTNGTVTEPRETAGRPVVGGRRSAAAPRWLARGVALAAFVADPGLFRVPARAGAVVPARPAALVLVLAAALVVVLAADLFVLAAALVRRLPGAVDFRGWDVRRGDGVSAVAISDPIPRSTNRTCGRHFGGVFTILSFRPQALGWNVDISASRSERTSRGLRN